MPTVVIAAGGTAGHVVPALAVADELRDRGADVVWVGTRDRAEAQLVPAAGYPIEYLAVRGLDRRNPLRANGASMRFASPRWLSASLRTSGVRRMTAASPTGPAT